MADTEALARSSKPACGRCAGKDKGSKKNPPRSDRPPNKRAWLGPVGALLPALLSLLPSFTCPLCVAAYAGVLSSLGLGFFHNERVLAPLIVIFLLIAVVSVAWTTRSHRRLLPLSATIVGTLAVALGRLVWSVPLLLYTGIALLLGGAVWNLVLKLRIRRQETVAV